MRFLLLTALTIFSVVASSKAADVDLSRLSLDPVMVFYVSDATKLETKYDQSIFGQAKLYERFMHMTGSGEDEAQTSKAEDESIELFDTISSEVEGQVTLLISYRDIKNPVENISMLFIGEYEDAEGAVNDNIAEFREHSREFNIALLKSPFAGVEIKELEVSDNEGGIFSSYYATMGDIVLLGTHKEELENAVLQIKDLKEGKVPSGKPHFNRNERFDFEIAFKLEQLINTSLQLANEAENPAVINLIRAFGLESVDGVYLGIDFSEESLDGVFRLPMNSDPQGLMKLFTLMVPYGKLPEYVPADVLMSEVTGIDLSGVMKTLEDIILNVDPQVRANYTRYLEQVKTNTGVDLRAGILENFGAGYSSVTGYAPSIAKSDRGMENSSNVYLINLRDPHAFEFAIDTLKQAFLAGFELFDAKEYLGETLYTLKNSAEAGKGVTYAIMGNNLVYSVGDQGFLESLIARMKRGSEGLWQQPHMREFVRDVPQNATMVHYVNLPPFLEMVFSDADFSESYKDVEFADEDLEVLKKLGMKLLSYSVFNNNTFEVHMKVRKTEK